MDKKYIDINGTPHLKSKIDNINNIKIVAKQSNDNYYILSSSDGELFNPITDSKSFSKKDDERGGRFYKLNKCSKETYNFYVSYLRSKNNTQLILAQRRFISEKN